MSERSYKTDQGQMPDVSRTAVASHCRNAQSAVILL